MFLQFFILSPLCRAISMLYFRIPTKVFEKCLAEQVIVYEMVEIFFKCALIGFTNTGGVLFKLLQSFQVEFLMMSFVSDISEAQV